MGALRSKITTEQIDDVVNDAYENIEDGTTRWSGMTYEQGVADALQWITGDREDSPFEEN